jgi:hypothetical protein
MNSPFKMKPGRGNMPKTGNGIPPTLMSCSPMKQEKPKKTDSKSGMTKAEAGEKINSIFSENSRRVAAEAMAKSDSAVAAKGAMLLGKVKKEAGRIGNEAANITRKKEKLPSVVRGREVSSGGVLNDPRNKDVYTRIGQLESDVPANVARAYRNNK